MNHKCKVCGEPAAGFHFGAFTCEGCKSFFGRAHTNPTAAAVNECKTGGGRCVIDKQNRTSCKACRLKKCLAAGMSKSGSRYGRRSNWFKIHCLLQLQQQRGRPADDERCDAVAGPPRSAFAPLQAPPPWPLLFFGSAPPNRGRARDLPLSERPAFGDGDHDRPVDLTVRQKFIDGSDDDDDDATTEKRSAKRRSFSPPAQHRDHEPLDLTRTNGCSKLLPGIRSGCRMISREF